MNIRVAERRRPGARQPGFIVRHLRGGYSLARSYWVHNMLFGWGLLLAWHWLAEIIAERYAVRYVSMAVMLFEVLLLTFWGWATVGTWMSAVRHFFSGGSRWWAGLTMAALICSAIGLIEEVPRLMPALVEHWELAHGKQPTDGYSLTLQSQGRELVFEGGINEGAAAALARMLTPPTKIEVLTLDSPGGWLREGDKMADVVRRYQLDTHVSRRCASACTLVFLAGRDRMMDQGARLGFHRGRGIGEPAAGHDDADPGSRERLFYRKAGLKESFVERIMATPHDEIWVPTRGELLKAGVLSR